MAPLQPQAGHMGLIIPLCTSSATIGLALYQYPVFMSFLQPVQGESLAGKPLSRFWHPMVRIQFPNYKSLAQIPDIDEMPQQVKQARLLIATLVGTSALSGLFAARWLRTHRTLETTNVSNWYLAGGALAIVHLASLPIIAQPVSRIIQAADSLDAEQRNREEMKTWLGIHTVRTVLVDLPALWCFAEGVAQSFWITSV